MENIIEVVEAKIKEYENSLVYIRVEEEKMLERKAAIICKIGALERELKELKAAPKKRKSQIETVKSKPINITI